MKRIAAFIFGLNCFFTPSNANDPAFHLDAFLYEICANSRTHSAHEKNTQIAARFYLSVKQACGMLENIIAGFKEGVFNGVPKIKESFYAINSSFGGYPNVSKIDKQKLVLIREQLTGYQAFLTSFKLENQMQFTDQEASFMLLLQRFNEFLIANILHEQYLPYMEEYETWWQKIENSPVTLPLLFGLTGFATWMGATIAGNYKNNETLKGEDFITGASVGTVFGLLGYIALSFRK